MVFQKGQSGNPGFKKGQSGNPNGRPRVPEIQLFREALATVEKEKKKTLLVHAVEQAFSDNTVLIAVLKKILPDMTSIDVSPILHRCVLVRPGGKGAPKAPAADTGAKGGEARKAAVKKVVKEIQKSLQKLGNKVVKRASRSQAQEQGKE